MYLTKLTAPFRYVDDDDDDDDGDDDGGKYNICLRLTKLLSYHLLFLYESAYAIVPFTIQHYV